MSFDTLEPRKNGHGQSCKCDECCRDDAKIFEQPVELTHDTVLETWQHALDNGAISTYNVEEIIGKLIKEIQFLNASLPHVQKTDENEREEFEKIYPHEARRSVDGCFARDWRNPNKYIDDELQRAWFWFREGCTRSPKRESIAPVVDHDKISKTARSIAEWEIEERKRSKALNNLRKVRGKILDHATLKNGELGSELNQIGKQLDAAIGELSSIEGGE